MAIIYSPKVTALNCEIGRSFGLLLLSNTEDKVQIVYIRQTLAVPRL